jgi:hypothetical protein
VIAGPFRRRREFKDVRKPLVGVLDLEWTACASVRNVAYVGCTTEGYAACCFTCERRGTAVVQLQVCVLCHNCRLGSFHTLKHRSIRDWSTAYAPSSLDPRHGSVVDRLLCMRYKYLVPHSHVGGSSFQVLETCEDSRCSNDVDVERVWCCFWGRLVKLVKL